MILGTESGSTVRTWNPTEILTPGERLRLLILKAELFKRGSGIILLRRLQFTRWLVDTERLTDE